MSTSRRVAALFDHRLVRRLVIIPLAVLAAVIVVALGPLLLIGAAAADLAGTDQHWRRVRLVLLITGALVIEMLGLIGSFLLWVTTGFGLLGRERWRWHRHRAILGWYTRTIFALITRVIGAPVIWHDNADLTTGPVVLIARHTSFFDALIPATVLSHRHRLLSHHVVTHGLRYAPCIDIVGHRFPNRFIKRDPGEGSNELGPIATVGAALDQRSAAIIFPEGTFRSPERFERVVRRINRRDPEMAEQANKLAHVLPPRSNGTYALLQGAPLADVVVCANTGLESFGSIKAIIDDPRTDRPVIIESWRIARSEIPDDPEKFNGWLFDQYVRIDDWVTTQQQRSH